MKAQNVPCIICGWAGEIHGSDHCNDEGLWLVACKGCGEQTALWAYQREAWKQWKFMNRSNLGNYAQPAQ